MPVRDQAAWARCGCPARIVSLISEGAVIEPFESGLGFAGSTGADDGDGDGDGDDGGDDDGGGGGGGGGGGSGGIGGEHAFASRAARADAQARRIESALSGRTFADAAAGRPVPEDGQYAWRSFEYFVRGAAECDRAIVAGHLEPVPSHLVGAAWALAPAHPWTVVLQHGDKWRAAQDYSRCTNQRVGRKPFTLPSVWDVRSVLRPSSYMAKYDLRDGFWSVPVAESSRPHLMVRHPATGRLL
jgi:hypothetical protein